jgi:DNA transformation protein
MFGGVGVYFDGIFFAVINDGVVYFRTSDATRAVFEAERSRAFTYATKNGPVEIASYWSVPERLLDEAGELRDWARDAIAAARAVSAAKEKKQRAKTSGRRSQVSPKRTKT